MNTNCQEERGDSDNDSHYNPRYIVPYPRAVYPMETDDIKKYPKIRNFCTAHTAENAECTQPPVLHRMKYMEALEPNSSTTRDVFEGTLRGHCSIPY